MLKKVDKGRARQVLFLSVSLFHIEELSVIRTNRASLLYFTSCCAKKGKRERDRRNGRKRKGEVQWDSLRKKERERGKKSVEEKKDVSFGSEMRRGMRGERDR